MNKLLLAGIALVALVGIALLWNVQAGAMSLGVPLTNTPAAPQGERGASFDLQQAPAILHTGDRPAQAQSQTWELDQPVQDANRIAALLQRAQALRQMEWRFPVPEMVGPLSVGPSGVSCADMLANSAMDIVKTSPTTGTIDSWVVLAHNIYYDDRSGYYNSPSYSLVMVDETNGYDQFLCNEALDCDAFGQAFKAPTNLVSVTIKYSRLYGNENTSDYSGYELWTVDSQGYLDQVIGSWGIGAGTGWSNRQATLDPTQVMSASGKMLALVFYMESNRTDPAEFVWLDDAQVVACFSVGARKVYLPLIIKQPSSSVVACVPYEPDNRDTRGSTVINAVCNGMFGPADDKDYYTLDLRGVSNIRLQLTNLPAGTNWDAMIYEYPYAGQPPACHIATPGSQNKYKDCTLNLAKNYFVLVSAGAAPGTQQGYQMAVVDRTPPPVTPTPTTPPVSGIYGQVRYNGSPVAGIYLILRYYNGSSWSTWGSPVATDASGNYRFTGVPNLGVGQKYYVRYSNGNNGNADNSNYVAAWWSFDITTYTAGSNVAGGNFDIANIALSSPGGGATVSLPRTFSWVRRTATTSDSYEWDLFDTADGDPYFYTNLLGYVNSYTLYSLPSGFTFGVPYGWNVWVYAPDGGSGASYYYRTVTFSTSATGLQAEVGAEQPLKGWLLDGLVEK